MFRVKICGITNVEDAIAAIEAGADAIGLNFYEQSPRCVSLDRAKEIAKGLRRTSSFRGHDVAKIGVFVNRAADEMAAIKSLGELSGIQLHGDESPEVLAAFERSATNWNLIRVRRVDDRGVAAIADDLTACTRAGRRPDAVLVDSMTTGRYGGTGVTVSWVGLADHKRWLGDTPLILAGGLTPDNVAEAIRIVRPAAVDVASGVESAPGKKDSVKVRDFVVNALGALAALLPPDG